MFKKIKLLVSAVMALGPLRAFSQSSPLDLNAAGTTIYDVLDYINDTLRFLNPILFSVAFVVFFWGLSKFILNSGNKDAIEKGKDYMLWSVLALFILVSFRVIISLITGDFGLGPATTTPQIPQA
jgi:hypothetical protein